MLQTSSARSTRQLQGWQPTLGRWGWGCLEQTGHFARASVLHTLSHQGGWSHRWGHRKTCSPWVQPPFLGEGEAMRSLAQNWLRIQPGSLSLLPDSHVPVCLTVAWETKEGGLDRPCHLSCWVVIEVAGFKVRKENWKWCFKMHCK